MTDLKMIYSHRNLRTQGLSKRTRCLCCDESRKSGPGKEEGFLKEKE
jgi:hypothetical protein